MGKYNIIGDIHGRTCWKELVQNDCTNIFVGDYFSPYHKDIAWEQQKQNFLDIIQYKKKHPETILLLGNHDINAWLLLDKGCSRHDYEHEKEIINLFEDNKELFQAAYSIENKYLVTHAGLSIRWLHRWLNSHKNTDKEIRPLLFNTYDLWYYNGKVKTIEEAVDAYLNHLPEYTIPLHREIKENDIAIFNHKWYYFNKGEWLLYEVTPDDCADFINAQYNTYPERFSFDYNCGPQDYYGTTPTHSPMWIRMEGLDISNIFSGTEFVQIFGHTISENIVTFNDGNEEQTGKCVMVDCLEAKTESYKIEL